MCGVLAPKRGDDAEALRRHVVKQREYHVLSESLSEACKLNCEEGFAKAVPSMIVLVGLKLDGRGLEDSVWQAVQILLNSKTFCGHTLLKLCCIDKLMLLTSNKLTHVDMLSILMMHQAYAEGSSSKGK